MMTFHESYGHLPMRLLRLYKKVNGSPADHDQVLAAFGYTWQDVENIPGIPSHKWDAMMRIVESHSADGILRLPRYL